MEAIEMCLGGQDHSQRRCIILILTETDSWFIFAHVPSKNTEESHDMRQTLQIFV